MTDNNPQTQRNVFIKRTALNGITDTHLLDEIKKYANIHYPEIDDAPGHEGDVFISDWKDALLESEAEFKIGYGEWRGKGRADIANAGVHIAGTIDQALEMALYFVSGKYID